MANGIYTNAELVDSLLSDLNNLLRDQAGGQYIQAAAVVTGMAQKLLNLRTGIDADLKNRDETIATLKEELRACGREVVEIAPEDLQKGA